MDVCLGFLIAALIAMTGVGAGSVTAPLLILFLHVPVTVAVGTSLAYSAAVKLLVVPVQMWRHQIAWRTLGVMLLTGIPGVVLGTALFHRVSANDGDKLWLYLALGTMIAFSSAWHIYRYFRPPQVSADRSPRPWWLAGAMLPVGAEVGFSSSGAGALGTIALLSWTALDASRVVGTDLAFGLCLSVVGGGLHFAHGGVDTALLMRLTIGGVLGALAGTGVASRVPARQMRLVLSVWLLVIGLQLCWQAANLAKS